MLIRRARAASGLSNPSDFSERTTEFSDRPRSFTTADTVCGDRVDCS
ncbi:Uncharacterised protein [Mycobacterium tuberculosis]|uniref:Uncharacterized protein n=1 Tax=Mycobacterium tuberculosis TaxID=1773 RepID=A0A0U0RHS8_MYCTX|nr:Uncharacterised protein [Mycobacterium tuberculosis]COZ52602.1 Uncharacterised protein [Mycobacterium tuberculosis]